MFAEHLLCEKKIYKNFSCGNELLYIKMNIFYMNCHTFSKMLHSYNGGSIMRKSTVYPPEKYYILVETFLNLKGNIR